MKNKDRNKKKKSPPRLNVTAEQIEQFVNRAQQVLPQKDYELLFAMSESLIFMRNAYEQKRISERNLLRMIFGPHSERAAVILGQTTGKYQKDKSEKQKQKPKGHGRNGSDDYPGAQRISVPHTTMKPGDGCPECCRGKVYREMEPKILIRFVAKVPVDATVYEAEQLRCNACGQIFDASLPAEAAKPKYDETVGAMIAVLRYGSGLPMNRIEVLQESFGIPLPASTQVCQNYPSRIVRRSHSNVLHSNNLEQKTSCFEANLLAKTLQQYDDVNDAARHLGMGARTLYRKMKKYGLRAKS